MLVLATTLKILSHCFKHNFLNIPIHQVENNLYLKTGACPGFLKGGSNISWFPKKRSSDFERGGPGKGGGSGPPDPPPPSGHAYEKCSFDYHTARMLQMICSTEKNDNTMHGERLANQKKLFRDGGVIFYFVAYISEPSVPQ